MKNYNEMAEAVFRRRDAYETARKKRNKVMIRTVGSLGCLCLVALLGVGVWQSGLLLRGTNEPGGEIAYPDQYVSGEEPDGANTEGPSVLPDPQDPAPEEEPSWPVLELPSGGTSGEGALVPKWEDLPIYQRYIQIDLETASYTARRGTVPAERLGEKLDTVQAKGDVGPGVRYHNAEVYTITGISSDYAVAVRYEGTEEYYSALNSSTRPDTLGQFIEDLNLQAEISFGPIWYDHQKPSGETVNIRFDDVDAEKIWQMLLSSPEAKNTYDDLDPTIRKSILGISVDIPLFGYENIGISVLEDGYIQTNILDTGKLFYIGEEHTEAFADYVLTQCEGYEILWLPSDTEPIPE